MAAAARPRRPPLAAGSRCGSPPPFPAAQGDPLFSPRCFSCELAVRVPTAAKRPGRAGPCCLMLRLLSRCPLLGEGAGLCFSAAFLLLQLVEELLCSFWEPAPVCWRFVLGENGKIHRLVAVKKGSLFYHEDAEKTCAMQDLSI